MAFCCVGPLLLLAAPTASGGNVCVSVGVAGALARMVAVVGDAGRRFLVALSKRFLTAFPGFTESKLIVLIFFPSASSSEVEKFRIAAMSSLPISASFCTLIQ